MADRRVWCDYPDCEAWTTWAWPKATREGWERMKGTVSVGKARVKLDLATCAYHRGEVVTLAHNFVRNANRAPSRQEKESR